MALEYPSELSYLDTHEYIRMDGDIATVGITAFAIDQLGDIVFLELPEVGDALERGATCGTVESVKAVEDLYAPLAGTVIERNDAAIEAPETLVDDPYIEGWLFKIKLAEDETLDEALTAQQYQSLVEGNA